MKILKLIIVTIFLISSTQEKGKNDKICSGVLLVVLGTTQDGGSPHIGCKKDCCKGLFENLVPARKVVCLGLIDYINEKSFILEATPDLPSQMKMLQHYANFSDDEVPDGILLTHAHIGHYSGLMYLGREALGAHKVPVYGMPKMNEFLQENGPWNQLVRLNNIMLNELTANKNLQLTPQIIIKPFLVPHRDEFSETVGFIIQGIEKSVLFIPDVDKWENWEMDIIEEIRDVDYAFIDATFFNAEEVNFRDISEIPHPFVIESMDIFKDLCEKEKNKIHFIHFNHTNPLLIPESQKSLEVINAGFRIAMMHDTFEL